MNKERSKWYLKFLSTVVIGKSLLFPIWKGMGVWVILTLSSQQYCEYQTNNGLGGFFRHHVSKYFNF